MSGTGQGAPSPSRALLWGAVGLLSLLGFLGNYTHVSVTFNVDFIFGSIFTLLAAALAGPRAGLLSALVASSYTWVLWNHPYAIVIFGAEALWVGLAYRRRRSSLLLASSLYWLCLGMPLVVLFYGGPLGQGAWGVAIIVLKQALNGIFNALIADLLLVLLPLDRWLLGTPRARKISFTHIIFHQTVLLLMLPTLVLIRITNQWEERRAVEALALTLRTQTRQNEEVLRSWIADQVRTVQAVAHLGAHFGVKASARLQEELAQARALSPDLHNVCLLDAQGRSVAFDPPVNEHGQSTLGAAFGDRAHFQEARRTRGLVISETFWGRTSAFQPIFTINVPLSGPEGFAGLAGGAVNLDRLKARLLRTEDAHLAMTLLDASDRILVSTLPTRRALEPLTSSPADRVRAIAPEVLLTLPANSRNKSVMEAWRLAFLSTRRPVAGTPWVLLAEYPMAPLRDDLYQATIRNLAWLLGWYLVALALATLASRALAKTPSQLVALSRDLPARVESGDVIAWPDSKIQEMSQLVANLRGLADALARRIREVHRETARTLEHERALVHQSRQAAMGEMVGNIAHQWRQPLNALSMVLGNLQDARRHQDLTDASFEASMAQGNALVQKMSSTISDFITFFRPDKTPTRFSLRQQAAEALHLVEPNLQHHRVTVEIAEGPDVFALGHPNEFSQVLLNLLANARDAIQQSGIAEGHIRIAISTGEGTAQMRLSDNGGGIHITPIERIFEPYLTDKDTGTGLGLYMSRMILEQSLGGTLEARNIPGGAEFTISIPLKEPDHASD